MLQNSQINAQLWIQEASKHLLNPKEYNENSFFQYEIQNQDEARREAQYIFCHSLNLSLLDIRLKNFFLLTKEDFERLQSNLERRKYGEPLAYIFGSKEFYGLDFYVNQHTLIPRPETEHLVDDILQRFDSNSSKFFVDFGCGSGCIALAILKHRPHWKALLVDIDADTLACARKNAEHLKLEKQAFFLQLDFTEKTAQEQIIQALQEHTINIKKVCSIQEMPHPKNLNHIPKKDTSTCQDYTIFDFIVSNPPYIPYNEYEKLHHSVQGFEPKQALVSEDITYLSSEVNQSISSSEIKSTEKSNIFTGLYHVQALIHLAQNMLKEKALLFIEHGYNQAEESRALCSSDYWENVTSGKDYAQIERYLIAQKK